ncbi:hypothetical protein GCM10023336_05210 [Streptomyces similanensis]|uniref:Peptidase inhibitor n=1 Tax=Streptomyces similanensis TaxID=1274988 RepID=A0ABP9JVE5_9ACTN
MRIRSRALSSLAAVALAVGGLTAAVATPAGAAPTAWSCPSGYFCAYTNFDGTGSRCQWQGDSSNWYNECSWASSTYPKSLFNNGTSGRGVTIYRYTGKVSPIGGCVDKGEHARLAGNYYIGSHSWNC